MRVCCKTVIDNREKLGYNFNIYVLPVEEEEYAQIAIREGRPTGCKAAREETRGMSLRRGQMKAFA